MSMFGSIMSKIFNAAESAVGINTAAATQATPAADATAPASSPTAESPPSADTAGQASAAPATPSQPVDVGAVLTGMASSKGGGGNYQTSIVDLLKLLDLDSSLTARKELATELNVHAGADGSAEENIALHKAVMQKLAENGGKVPDAMKG